MITITSEMMKEDENEVVAKKFEDWRMKRQSSYLLLCGSGFSG